MKSAIFRGLRLPICVTAVILLAVAFFAIPVYIAYFGAALSATDSVKALLYLMHPGKFWAWALHLRFVMAMTLIAGLKMICQVISLIGGSGHREQADPLSRLMCAVTAALAAALLIKLGSVALPWFHLSEDVIHGPLSLFWQPHDNMRPSSEGYLAHENHTDVFGAVLMFYGMGFAFAPTLPIFKDKKIVRGVEPASYEKLRGAPLEPDRNIPRPNLK